MNVGKGKKRKNSREMRQRRNKRRGGAEERRREAPMATLSEQRSWRVTVKQTDRTPPKVTNAFIYQTHTGAMAGCVLSVSTGCRKHSVGRVTD